VEATVNWPVRTKVESIVHDNGGDVAKSEGVDGNALMRLTQFVVLASKPEPVIRTEVPGPPLVGLRVKLDVTRNCVVVWSFAALPVAVTV
jgi:hypothetical protein